MKPSGPLKRNGIKLKKTRQGWNSTLRPKSDKRIMEDNALAPDLRQYRQRFPKCQGRGCKSKGRDIHEIAGGPLRMLARKKRSCILHLCRDCHRLMQHRPKVEQLAVKLLADPEGYDLDEYNALVEGHLKQWEQGDVDVALEVLVKREK